MTDTVTLPRAGLETFVAETSALVDKSPSTKAEP